MVTPPPRPALDAPLALGMRRPCFRRSLNESDETIHHGARLLTSPTSDRRNWKRGSRRPRWNGTTQVDRSAGKSRPIIAHSRSRSWPGSRTCDSRIGTNVEELASPAPSHARDVTADVAATKPPIEAHATSRGFTPTPPLASLSYAARATRRTSTASSIPHQSGPSPPRNQCSQWRPDSRKLLPQSSSKP